MRMLKVTHPSGQHQWTLTVPDFVAWITNPRSPLGVWTVEPFEATVLDSEPRRPYVDDEAASQADRDARRYPRSNRWPSHG